jgi:hypothetical protein
MKCIKVMTYISFKNIEKSDDMVGVNSRWSLIPATVNPITVNVFKPYVIIILFGNGSTKWY